MSRKTVLTVFLALLTATVGWADWVQMDPGHVPDAQLNLVAENGSTIEFDWSAGGFNFETDGQMYLAGESSDETSSLHARGGLVVLPWGYNGNLEITAGTVVSYNRELDSIGDEVDFADAPQNTWAYLGESMIWRDVTVASLVINPFMEDEEGNLWMATDLNIEVQAASPMNNAPSYRQQDISPDFFELYQDMLLNGLDELGSRVSINRGSYLIIIPTGYNMQEILDFANWKRQLGYNAIVEIVETGISQQDLRDIIHNYYNTLDPGLDYVLLVGDTGRGSPNTIPTFSITNPLDANEIDASDLPYVTIEGDDYFPEAFVGRWTVGSRQEVAKLATRSIRYEKEPFYIENDHRWNGAVLIAANYAEGGLTPHTPVATMQWLEGYMTNWGLDVRTHYWEQGGDPVLPEHIIGSIEEGTMWVAYRGWGNSTSWVQPPFDTGDLANLGNANLLPVVTSFVCNTGDFDSPANGHKCFGETWITEGSVAAPRGGVAFIGPTDLHTKTKYNNPLLAGFYWGVYPEAKTCISQALIRAKMELVYGHPIDAGVGSLPDQAGIVQFYWHVYHVLGDPSLRMWRHRPLEMNVTHDAQATVGQTSFDVDVDFAAGTVDNFVYVQATQGNNLIDGRFVDETGYVDLSFVGAEAGDVTITVSRGDFEPQISTVQLVEEANYIDVEEFEIVGDVNVSGTCDLALTLKNYGTSNQENVTATISNDNSELVTINTSTASFGTIAGGAQANNGSSPFSFTLNNYSLDNVELEFSVEITGSNGGPFTGKVWVPVSTPKFHLESYSIVNGSTLEPGEEAQLELSLMNIGSGEATNASITVTSWDEAVTMNNATASIGNVAAGALGTTATPISFTVDASVAPSRVLKFSATLVGGDDSYGSCAFSLPLEGVETTDPLGPDEYGYFAYDDTDAGWAQTPTYDWPGLAEGGATMLADLVDDENTTTTLPFDFQFYGNTYTAGSTLTLSSNGWFAFGEQPEYSVYYFRNWQLPSLLGPMAVVAPFWDDLGSVVGELVEVYTEYNEDDHVFIIEYPNTILRFNPDDEIPAEFAVKFFDPAFYATPTGDGIIEFHYRSVDNADERNNGATVGIEHPNHTVGLQYTYARLYPDAAAPLEAGRAIRFTTVAPDNIEDITIPGSQIPGEFALHNSYPNPFNSTTEIRFDLPQSAPVKLAVYNTLGQLVTTLVEREMQAGYQTIVFDASNLNLSSGMLLVRLEAGNNNAWGKMLYLK